MKRDQENYGAPSLAPMHALQKSQKEEREKVAERIFEEIMERAV